MTQENNSMKKVNAVNIQKMAQEMINNCVRIELDYTGTKNQYTRKCYKINDMNHLKNYYNLIEKNYNQNYDKLIRVSLILKSTYKCKTEDKINVQKYLYDYIRK